MRTFGGSFDCGTRFEGSVDVVVTSRERVRFAPLVGDVMQVSGDDSGVLPVIPSGIRVSTITSVSTFITTGQKVL